MTRRKPPGATWESWIDRQIREGMERGEFDGLPGHRKPLPAAGRPRDELWWVKDKPRREEEWRAARRADGWNVHCNSRGASCV